MGDWVNMLSRRPVLPQQSSNHIRASSAASANDALIEMLERPRKPSISDSERPQIARELVSTVPKAELSPSMSIAPSLLSLDKQTMSSRYTASRPQTAASTQSSMTTSSSSSKRSKWFFGKSRANKSAPCVVSEPVPRQDPPILGPWQRLSTFSATNLLSQIDSREERMAYLTLPPDADDEQERLHSPVFDRRFAVLRDECSMAIPEMPEKPFKQKKGFFRLFRSGLNSELQERGKKGLAVEERGRKGSVPKASVQPFELPGPLRLPERMRPLSPQKGSSKALRRRSIQNAQEDKTIEATSRLKAMEAVTNPRPAQPIHERSPHGSNKSEDLDWLARSSMLFGSKQQSPPRQTLPRNLAPLPPMTTPSRLPAPASVERPVSPDFVSMPMKPKPLPVQRGPELSSPTRPRFHQNIASAVARSGSSSSVSSSQILSSSNYSAPTSSTSVESATQCAQERDPRANTKVSGWLQQVGRVEKAVKTRAPVGSNKDKPLPMTGGAEPYMRTSGDSSRAPGTGNSDGSLLDPKFGVLELEQEARDLLRTTTPARPEYMRAPSREELKTWSDGGSTPRAEEVAALLPPVQLSPRDRHVSDLSNATETFPASVRSSASEDDMTRTSPVHAAYRNAQGGATPTQKTYRTLLNESPTTAQRDGSAGAGGMLASLTHPAASPDSSELASLTHSNSDDPLAEARRILAEARAARQKVTERVCNRDLTRSPSSQSSGSSSGTSYSAELERAREIRERLMRKMEAQRQLRVARAVA